MKFKSLYFKQYYNFLAIGILLSVLLKTKPSLGTPLTSREGITPQSKSLGKEDFTYGENITHQFLGSKIVTRFAPKNSQGENIDIHQLASSLGYDHFNWASYVEQDPYGIRNQAGSKMQIPYNDPPQGGYLYDSADKLPFYWDLVNCDRCKPRHHFRNSHNLSQFELVFQDSPADYRLQPGEAVEFVTHLVGVKQYDPQQQTAAWEILYTFRWQLTNPHPNLSRVSLIEADVTLNELSSELLSVMQRDGAVLNLK